MLSQYLVFLGGVFFSHRLTNNFQHHVIRAEAAEWPSAGKSGPFMHDPAAMNQEMKADFSVKRWLLINKYIQYIFDLSIYLSPFEQLPLAGGRDTELTG